MTGKKPLSIRFILTTLLVIAAVAVLIRLGIWQLDRLTWRRAFNTRVLAQIDRPMLDLNAEMPVDTLYDMEYRFASVQGHFDASQQVLLRNQVWDGQNGYHLLTPLLIDGSRFAVLVDRGWIPFDRADHLAEYAVVGETQISGRLRRPQIQPDFGGVPDPTLQPGQTRLNAVNIINLQRIQEQVNVPLLPVYIQESPSVGQIAPPYASLSEVEITEGPHMGYAMQWFAFATILAVGYPFFIRRQNINNINPQSEESQTENWFQGETK